MKLRILSALLILTLLFVSCQKGDENKVDTQMPQTGHKVKILEVIQARAYTYLKVEENDKDYWMAINKSSTLKEDDIIYYNVALEMKNFRSEDLNRTFESIYFVEQISDKPMINPHAMNATSPMKRKTSKKDASISIEPVSGGISIAELYKNISSYADKQVKIKGQVTKFNPAIMGKNWIHIQDGSEADGKYDLTITTQAKVKVGDVVVLEGTILLNQDFGAGYSYDVIMEKAKLIENSNVVL